MAMPQCLKQWCRYGRVCHGAYFTRQCKAQQCSTRQRLVTACTCVHDAALQQLPLYDSIPDDDRLTMFLGSLVCHCGTVDNSGTPEPYAWPTTGGRSPVMYRIAFGMPSLSASAVPPASTTSTRARSAPKPCNSQVCVPMDMTATESWHAWFGVVWCSVMWCPKTNVM